MATTKNEIIRRPVNATNSRPNQNLTKEHPDPEITQGKKIEGHNQDVKIYFFTKIHMRLQWSPFSLPYLII
jgi:hypothetical protein